MTSTRSLRAKALLTLQSIGLAPIPDVPDEMAGNLSAAECQAARQLLLMTQAEAAEWMSTTPVSERAWQYWEAGRRAVPADVAMTLRSACISRDMAIARALEAIHQAPGQRQVGVWYAKVDDWKWTLRRHGLDWKLHNSVVAHLTGQGLVKLVGFDEAAYLAWSRDLPKITSDGEMTRHAEWARSTLAPPPRG
ncbi:Aca2/YdiL-like domain-containing protein [Paucibacter soli]|uniref:Aca2/YdiL-like domain-containing protein n=1 Tax=Paucibacter soli TaxID=3133433 RepID=UPI003095AB3D